MIKYCGHTAQNTLFKKRTSCSVRSYLNYSGRPLTDHLAVVGTLDVRDYALLVSHGDSDQKVCIGMKHRSLCLKPLTCAQAFFNVHRSRQPGEPWGSFSIDTHEGATPLFAEKVSRVGGENTVLVARLRFPPDKTEPTLL